MEYGIGASHLAASGSNCQDTTDDAREALQGRALIVDRGFYECSIARGVLQLAGCTWDDISASQKNIEASVVVAMGLPEENINLDGWTTVGTRTSAGGCHTVFDDVKIADGVGNDLEFSGSQIS